MRLVFAGTPEFAARALAAVHEAGHDVCLVLTQPDRPAGRGLKLTRSAVAQLAFELGLAVEKPESLKLPQAQDLIVRAAPEIMVVAAYGLLLPERVLAIPPSGCLNIHASLLPRWRGAAPIPRAILAGDSETGVAIIRMEKGLDTGPVLLERRTPIQPNDTSGILTDRLAKMGATALVEALANLKDLEPRPQESAGATYAAKLAREEAPIDWTRSCLEVDRQIRAFNPFPGAETTLGSETIKIWEARPVEGHGPAGTVISHDSGRPIVACGSGALLLAVIQRSGSRRLPTPEFLRARPMPVGTAFMGCPSGD